jgi:Tfp pilus assembly protein PilZ
MQRRSVLAVGEHGIALSSLSERTRRLGFRVVRARTFEDAIALCHARNFHYGVALIDPNMAIGNLWQAIRELKAESGSETLTCIAIGPPPEREIREWLRDSDVTVALWEPVGDHALRFQLNRGMSAHPDILQRSTVRAPTEWRARVFTAGREKPASVYSISDTGAFLETQRPSVSGAEIGLELSLLDGPVSVTGRVVYTNVPGNLQCNRLPMGMAIHFNDTSSETTNAIARSVSESAKAFVV